MKLFVDKKELQDTLKLVASVLPPRSIHPVLSNILFTVSEGELKLLGTDQDMTLEATVPASIDEEGAIGVPARKMTDLLNTLDNGEIELSTDETRLEIKQGRGKFHIAGVKASDFPSVDIATDTNAEIRIERDVMERMINLTSFAVSRDIARINFSGLFFKITENLLTMVGTDGQRLLLVRRITDADNLPGEILIPSRTIDQIKKIFKATIEQNVVLKYGNGALMLESGPYALQSKLITERFPDYEQVIPRDNDKTIVADKGILGSALSRVSVLANPASSLVKFNLATENLTISGRDYELGTEAKEEISINYEGEEFAIGFSSKNMLQILEHIDSNEVELSMKTPHSAVTLIPQPQVDDETYMAILMPLRLTGDE